MFIGEGIEGFYLLRGIPHAEAKYIPPQEFPDNAREGILACLDCVNSTFSNSPEIIREWNNWTHLYCPATNSTHDYVQQLRQNGVGYHIPLKALLLDSTQILNFPAQHEGIKNQCEHSPSIIQTCSNGLRYYQRLCIR